MTPRNWRTSIVAKVEDGRLVTTWTVECDDRVSFIQAIGVEVDEQGRKDGSAAVAERHLAECDPCREWIAERRLETPSRN